MAWGMFLHTQQIWICPLASMLNFGSIFKKSLAHSHAARKEMLKFQKNDEFLELTSGGQHHHSDYDQSSIQEVNTWADL